MDYDLFKIFHINGKHFIYFCIGPVILGETNELWDTGPTYVRNVDTLCH